MRIERINESKIKVLIGSDEARAFNVTPKKIAENSPEAQEIFRRVFSIAKQSIDFSVDDAKLFVETIPSISDGIGMLITKFSNAEEFGNALSNCSYKGKIRRRHLSPSSPAPKKHNHIYKFDSFDSLCAASNLLKPKYNGDSVLYKLKEAFYLHLMPYDAISQCETEILLCEFAEHMQSGSHFLGKLNEYGSMMIKNNAISVLNQYF